MDPKDSEVKPSTTEIVIPFQMPIKKPAMDANAVLEAAAEEGRKAEALKAAEQHVSGAMDEEGPAMVKMNPKAIVTWYDDEGKTTHQEATFRSLPVLAEFLEKAAEAGRPLDTRVSVHLQLIDYFIKPRPEDPDQKPRTTVTIKSGRLGEVIEFLHKKTVVPQAVLANLQGLAYSLADVSTLKGIIISVVMEDARAAGFGLVSESCEVTDEDIQVLAAAASNQAEIFKATMKKKRNMAFPDESPIVAASQGELLKLTNGMGARG